MKIKINGSYYSFFDEVVINEKFDSVASSFSLKARYNPNNESHRQIFKPLAFNKVEIYDDENVLRLTGFTVNTSLRSSSIRELQILSGYSKAGILEDCTIPYILYPLEKNNVSLSDIVSKILPYFKLSFETDATAKKDMELQYAKTVAEPSESVKSYLSKLASQRNIILSHKSNGDLLFFKPDVNSKPKYYFTKENALDMGFDVSGQGIHSDITVLRQPSDENPSLSPVDSVKNPLVLFDRSVVKTLSSGTETDTKKAADNLMAEELKNIKFTVLLKGKFNDLFCGDIVEVMNNEIFLYERTRLIVSEITRNESSKGDTVSLVLFLPETYTGDKPKIKFQ